MEKVRDIGLVDKSVLRFSAGDIGDLTMALLVSTCLPFKVLRSSVKGKQKLSAM